MRRYETTVILDSDLSEEERTPVFERLSGLIPQYKGFLVNIDEWGVKKLAYEIKKKPRGYYALIDFCGHGDLVGEIERFFRIDDRILKYMTVLVDENANVERIKEEIAEKEKKAAEAAALLAKETPETAPAETPEAPLTTEAAGEPLAPEVSHESEVKTETQQETTEEE